MSQTLWSFIGLSAAFLTMFSFVPQIVKVWRTRSAKDVSFAMLLQLASGVSLWILYGIHLKDAIIIIANVVTLTCLVILMWLYRRYAHNESEPGSIEPGSERLE